MYGVDYHNLVEDATVIPSVQINMNKTSASVLNKLKNIGKDGFVSNMIKENKVIARYATYGLAAGFITAIFTKNNKFIYSLFGAIGGMAIGGIVNNRMIAKEKQQKNIKK